MSATFNTIEHERKSRAHSREISSETPGRIFKQDRSLDARLLFTLEAIRSRSLYVSLNEQIASALNALSVAQLTTDQRLEKAGDSERTFYLINFIVTLTKTASDRFSVYHLT